MDQGVWIAMLAGLGIGAALGWGAAFFASRRHAGAAAQAHLEVATLSERVGRLQADLDGLQARHAALDAELRESRDRLLAEREQHAGVMSELRERLGAAQSTVASQAVTVRELQNALEQANDKGATTSAELSSSQSRISQLETQLQAEAARLEERLQWANEQKDELASRFKSLANEILEEKSKRFTEQNQSNLEGLLAPLRVKLHEFQGKVEEVYVNEGKDRAALAEQVRSLMALNQQLSADAHSLTSALKGQSKTQGDWGEVILERVLEESGLLKGVHYQAQVSLKQEDGRSQRPDVVIRLPEGRSLVVDSKVSLTAYHDYSAADARAGQEQALKAHLGSIRGHIKGLSEKNYQKLYGLTTLDFVLMFVPVEPAFMLAISHDTELWRDAWQRNVILVSPSTTLFVLRTVAHLWRQDQQSRSAQEIARRGAELYDKLVGFVKDLQQVGERLQLARTSYDEAMSKLAEGRGNVIRQAEMLRELGVKPTKPLPQDLVRVAADSDAQEPLFPTDKAA